MSTSVCLLDEPFTTVVELDSLKRLDGLYAFYHKYWWCRRQMFDYYKLCNAILNGLALLTAWPRVSSWDPCGKTGTRW